MIEQGKHVSTSVHFMFNYLPVLGLSVRTYDANFECRKVDLHRSPTTHVASLTASSNRELHVTRPLEQRGRTTRDFETQGQAV